MKIVAESHYDDKDALGPYAINKDILCELVSSAQFNIGSAHHNGQKHDSCDINSLFVRIFSHCACFFFFFFFDSLSLSSLSLSLSLPLSLSLF
jgi:hypothetical protein